MAIPVYRPKQPRADANADGATVKITDLTEDGRGVARIDGKAVFVEEALPGESGQIQIIKRRRKLDEGVWQQRTIDSPHRVTPKCAHFGVCGGCLLQHLAPDQQRVIKQQQLVRHLCHALDEKEPSFNVLPPVVSQDHDDTWHYRRRARLGVKWVEKKQRVLVGFRERRMPYIADLARCEVLAEPLGSLIEPLGHLIAKLSIKNKVPQIEAAVGDNATALVFRVLQPPTEADVKLMTEFLGQHQLQGYLQPGNLDTVAPMAAGYEPLTYRLPQFDLTLEFSPTDFVQIHAGVNRAMLNTAMSLLSIEDHHRVVDFFCGLGNFSLPMARSASHVTGVELGRALIKKAKANANSNKLSNVSFHEGNLFEPFEHAQWAQASYDLALIDPPRAGAERVCQFLTEHRVERLVYVSCHAASLARDAKQLVSSGYRLSSAGMLDMFPHTGHAEAIALFEAN